ncbi:bifunctional folylpolyglutamate synthase/dihydrofolate synthase [Aquisalinus flavus]|uniref:Dihydrofolate synthase/folylpolyglutamate synthase n=1 Tax=Aquisalinus flavus TaxID=1526572 RepID=A0A8J2V7A2_9PROT|nr:folylpolyglutamate synthase/dihydrofolate synthase family protein [Aquisalinus flavus]MBD0425350.1 bifunctional folylpolyglutamate synthase/dihydrofolate synthase [Aquisalinus flavus]UNE48999.1 bifunctional folylpolyglutamate synthase/dihydrofolate synthase [Aquisalinus flavus]GGD16806.1 bifunctional folylpolyglutamate synthase/dihydrofolate synthase [Aquisalinus flavus]
MQRNSADVNALLARLAERRPRVIDLSLARVRQGLQRLGSPHLKLPPVIHVAGTNGKGSVIAYMRAILAAAGHRVHVYTSPHLVRFNERIVLASEQIEDQELLRVLGKCEAAAGDVELTYFEAVTCAALLAFAETPADILLLETGLGGRLDATNVVDDPIASVITPIGLDHQDYLGDTIEKIAFEKAGIIKKGRPAVIGAQRQEALKVLEDRALALGAPMHIAGQDWSAHQEQGRLVYQDETSLSDLSLPRMLGGHQVENAGLAVAALKAAGVAPNDDKISAGLEGAFWPARLQRLTTGPLVELARSKAHEDVEIWLDGGHNPHAARAIARAMADLEERQPRPLILISGLQENKDADGFFGCFADLVSMVLTVQAQTGTASDPEKVAVSARHAGLPAIACDSVESALKEALDSAFRSNEGAPRILICGSLYLAGEVLEDNG